MRCSTAIIQALMAHPNYRIYNWVMEEAVNMAKPLVYGKSRIPEEFPMGCSKH